MPDDTGSFRVDVEIENPARPGERRAVRSVLVDTGAELSWVPAEVLAVPPQDFGHRAGRGHGFDPPVLQPAFDLPASPRRMGKACVGHLLFELPAGLPRTPARAIP